MRIVLTRAEMWVALMVAGMRTISSTLAKHNSANHAPDKGGDVWGRGIEGTAAEIVAAKALNLYWEPTVNNFHGTDGCGVQVRHTRLENGRLIVRGSDKDEDKFVFVTGELGSYEVHGWLYGRDAKQSKYLKNPEQLSGVARSGIPAYFVPKGDLLPIGTLSSPDGDGPRPAEEEQLQERTVGDLSPVRGD